MLRALWGRLLLWSMCQSPMTVLGFEQGVESFDVEEFVARVGVKGLAPGAPPWRAGIDEHGEGGR